MLGLPEGPRDPQGPEDAHDDGTGSPAATLTALLVGLAVLTALVVGGVLLVRQGPAAAPAPCGPATLARADAAWQQFRLTYAPDPRPAWFQGGGSGLSPDSRQPEVLVNIDRAAAPDDLPTCLDDVPVTYLDLEFLPD